MFIGLYYWQAFFWGGVMFDFYSSLHTLDINSLSEAQFPNLSSYSTGCLCGLLMAMFALQELSKFV